MPCRTLEIRQQFLVRSRIQLQGDSQQQQTRVVVAVVQASKLGIRWAGPTSHASSLAKSNVEAKATTGFQSSSTAPGRRFSDLTSAGVDEDWPNEVDALMTVCVRCACFNGLLGQRAQFLVGGFERALHGLRVVVGDLAQHLRHGTLGQRGLVAGVRRLGATVAGADHLLPVARGTQRAGKPLRASCARRSILWPSAACTPDRGAERRAVIIPCPWAG